MERERGDSRVRGGGSGWRGTGSVASGDDCGRPASETRPGLWRERERARGRKDETQGLRAADLGGEVPDLWCLAIVRGGRRQKLDRKCGEREREEAHGLGRRIYGVWQWLGAADLGGETPDLQLPAMVGVVAV